MTVSEIGSRIDSLDLWDKIRPYHWALKPRGTALPYFCVIMKCDIAPIKARILLLEGWKTFQDFMRLRLDRSFGFYSSPEEFNFYELVVLSNGEDNRLFRHETGYKPVEVRGAGEELCRKMLWEVLGMMMRVENDSQLPLKFATDRAIFARVEGADGIWRDEPLEVPVPQPHVERISIEANDVKQAKDLVFAPEEVLDLDFRIMPGLYTTESRPRCIYMLCATDAKTGERVIFDSLVISHETGLRRAWESVPQRVVKHMLARKRVPGEIRLLSQRMFRIMRPLCIHIPFKLSLHDKLPLLEKGFRSAL